MNHHLQSGDAPSSLLWGRFEADTLARYPGAAYALSPDLRLTYMNPAWFRFARDNGASPAFFNRWREGASIMDAVPQVLREFYQALFQRAIAERHRRTPIQFAYECSSRDWFRLFVMSLYPVEPTGELLVVNAPRIIHDHAAVLSRSQAYEDANGLVTQCAHCRCVRAPQDPERWDWIPEWVENFPANTSHGLCPICFDYYYPARRR